MDAYTIVGVRLFAALAITAAVVVALVLFAGVPWWIGLIVLAIVNCAELAWAYLTLKRTRTHRR